MGKLGDDQASIQNRMGYLYESISGPLFMGILNAVGLFNQQRDVFWRERPDGLYSAATFTLAYTLHAFPFDIASVLIFAGFGYFMMGLYLNLMTFVIYCFAAFAMLHIGESIGMTMCACFANVVGSKLSIGVERGTNVTHSVGTKLFIVITECRKQRQLSCYFHHSSCWKRISSQCIKAS